MPLIQNRFSGQECRVILQLAIPIIIAQLSQTAMGFVDTLMAGRYGAEDLAAVALGSGIWLPVSISLGGILIAITPSVAQLVGANRTQATPATLHHGLLCALLTSVIACLILQNSKLILTHMEISTVLMQKTADYLRAVSWGVPAMMFYQCCRSYCEGFGKTRPLMKIGIFALLCNIPLNYIFIYGKFGLPEMGGVGCGWATAAVMWIMAICAGLHLHRSTLFSPLQLLRRRSAFQPELIKSLLLLGIPIGFTLLIEVSMFSVIALIIARLGTTVLSAHQITLSFSGLVFMIPLSIAMALTIRTGQLIGSGDAHQARIAGNTGLLITTLGAILSCTSISLLATEIATLYTTESAIIRLASNLLLIAAIFQIPDAIMTTCAGILRGYKDTTRPLLMVFTAFWVIGLPSGYSLGMTDIFGPAMGAAGFWYSLVLGLTVGAILLLFRYQTISKQWIMACSTEPSA